MASSVRRSTFALGWTTREVSSTRRPSVLTVISAEGCGVPGRTGRDAEAGPRAVTDGTEQQTVLHRVAQCSAEKTVAGSPDSRPGRARWCRPRARPSAAGDEPDPFGGPAHGAPPRSTGWAFFIGDRRDEVAGLAARWVASRPRRCGGWGGLPARATSSGSASTGARPYGCRAPGDSVTRARDGRARVRSSGRFDQATSVRSSTSGIEPLGSAAIGRQPSCRGRAAGRTGHGRSPSCEPGYRPVRSVDPRSDVSRE